MTCPLCTTADVPLVATPVAGGPADVFVNICEACADPETPVVLIKDLNVKGAGFTAKRGTAVHRISLVADNADHIEGRVEGQRIVILTEFVKKRG